MYIVAEDLENLEPLTLAHFLGATKPHGIGAASFLTAVAKGLTPPTRLWSYDSGHVSYEYTPPSPPTPDTPHSIGKPASQAVHSRLPFMPLAEHLTALCAWCMQAMFVWSGKTRRALSRHCRDVRVYGPTTTAMHGIEHPPPPKKKKPSGDFRSLSPLTPSGFPRRLISLVLA